MGVDVFTVTFCLCCVRTVKNTIYLQPHPHTPHSHAHPFHPPTLTLFLHTHLTQTRLGFSHHMWSEIKYILLFCYALFTNQCHFKSSKNDNFPEIVNLVIFNGLTWSMVLLFFHNICSCSKTCSDVWCLYWHPKHTGVSNKCICLYSTAFSHSFSAG